jgi:cell wall-associated NlpC family hydrolase
MEVGVKFQAEFRLRPIPREVVIEVARTWLGTPYHHMARVRGAGVDCGQLPLAVYAAAGCIPHIETHYYPPDFFIHRDYEWYREIVETWAGEVERPQMADVVLFRYGRLFAHGGIIVEWPTIIHADRSRGMVVYGNAMQGQLRDRPRAFFRPKAFD